MCRAAVSQSGVAVCLFGVILYLGPRAPGSQWGGVLKRAPSGALWRLDVLQDAIDWHAFSRANEQNQSTTLQLQERNGHSTQMRTHNTSGRQVHKYCTGVLMVVEGCGEFQAHMQGCYPHSGVSRHPCMPSTTLSPPEHWSAGVADEASPPNRTNQHKTYTKPTKVAASGPFPFFQ